MNFGNVNFKTFVVCEFLVASTALNNSWCRGKDFNGWFFSTFLGLFGMPRLDIAWSFNICSMQEVNFDCAVSFSTGVDLSTELRFIVVGLTFVASDMEVNCLEFAGVGIGSDCSFECVVAGKQVEVKPTVENNS